MPWVIPSVSEPLGRQIRVRRRRDSQAERMGRASGGRDESVRIQSGVDISISCLSKD